MRHLMTFGGITGEVKTISEDGDFVLVELCPRISIIGTYTNPWNWELQPDQDSGFEAFLTYIGIRNQDDAVAVMKWAQNNGGYFKATEFQPRIAKRVIHYPFEWKIRGLDKATVVALAKSYKKQLVRI